MAKRAVVLISGGLDSTTCVAMAKAKGFEPVCLAVAYGQRHVVELERARDVASAMGVKDFRVVSIDLRQIGGSALTADIDVPKDRPADEMSHGIPVTYVPARNALFLSLALGLAEVVGSTDIYIGVNAVDYSGYPDCRPEFIRSFEAMANLATKAGVEGASFTVHAPLSGLTKADIIREGTRLGVDYGMTHSCYDPDAQGLACGRCDSCLLRKKGFEEAGVPDPTRYTVGA
ncbi:7-cyano-7-deazaguanine synthase QueC [Myxococcus sp. CA051A]|uniref:7-cyano-7-deazaguanine synthase n=1 Tax=Myxococcus llanfairpwllgwyngyllgogerychwyrndrobwllllantysiliogogogochensis TaxID=2590453 RepID=A0A540X293_9BACT|nr:MULTISPECIES: 7-cyano-7-deazaguanine synthase QueC [Myxococcus]NTX03377.1 7-cyano-7-deazaguanine synthase QueC [Myxococcus sp. CA040A]NTX11787.1 7-cyano-7-deazaguanine synthase QueC [Myxococcus sp. CA056]NTX34112.1 7-cyano-7-deazaguanine synthase QueC [Myxococcus sp. CA033]NTX65703.1 7-cyano-7-deazaguanine synthase QueC [Myxococcus sp. CA051A]TQF15356.1 7-cyano-7-deazaguanine synthase QueC [Myxococcus llanfairpwllgwyngyllgogerychwyrndrobwllllantysiliogogogochensis]